MPPLAEAFVTSGASRHQLAEAEPVLVPAGPVVLSIYGIKPGESVRLDGRPMSVAVDAARSEATAAINLTRSTGFHALQVGSQARFLFGTEDAKLRIDGVVEMLRYLRERGSTAGLVWNGTLQFSGTEQVLRDARLDYAWLSKTVDEVEQLARSIARRPFRVGVLRIERAREGIPDIARTAALARRQPELVERHPGGPIEFDGEAWAPLELVRRRREQTADTPGNRTVTRLVVAMLQLARTTREAAPPGLHLAIDDYVTRLRACAALEPFRTIRRQRGHLRTSWRPAREEVADARYRRCRAVLRELIDDRRWDPRTQVSDQWAFSALADQVYQAFVALVLADAYGLTPAGPMTGAGPHFASDEYELWVDRMPTDDVLHNWRDDTSTPSSLRPDIVIRRRLDGRVAVVDAKYRTGGVRAAPDSLSEIQLYLQAFGIPSAAVAFPPIGNATPQPHLVTNGHFNLLELPIRPADDLKEHLESSLLPALEGLFHKPRASAAAIAEEREEAQATAVQAAAARTLVADGEVVRLTQPHAMVAPANNLRRALADEWASLGSDIQKMLITAVYFGDQVPEGFDHSGPVLGLFAACERLTRDRLFEPSAAAVKGEYRRVTFGEAAEALRRVPFWRSGREKLLRNWVQQQRGGDLEALGKCGRTMKDVNKWRIAAAHSVLVDKVTWDRTHNVVLDSESGLLVSLCRALPNPATR